jgi:polyferredoxin
MQESVESQPAPRPPSSRLSGLERVRDFVTGRWFFKTAFLVYFVFACMQLLRFLAWARGSGPYVGRSEIVGGLLPVGHFTSFFAFLRGGGFDELLPAGLVIIIGALAVSLLFKRGFCGWICPVGTVWEGFSAVGRALTKGRQVRVPTWLDWGGRGFRFLLTALTVFLLLVLLPVQEAVDFRSLPYMWVADMKILTIMLQPTYLLVALLAGVLSTLFGPVWCRYLCPVGGLYAAVGELSPCKVARNEANCTHCSRCTKVCHAFVDIESKQVVRDTECDGCMDCVKSCPADNCLEARGPGGVRIAPWVWPLLVVGLWLAIFSAAKLTGNWDTHLRPDDFRAAVSSGVLEQSSMPSSRP